jgi:multidrug efflux system membrane fusion protein
MSQLKKKHMSNDPRNFIAKVTGGELRRSHLIAIGIAVAILLWFVSGFFTGPSRNGNGMTAAEADAANTVVPKVRVIESQATLRQGFVTIRGRTEAKRAVQVRAETQGTVLELPVEKGQRVAKGDVLCRLRIDARDAQLAEARALVAQRKLQYDASRQLAEKGHRAPTAAAADKAAYDAALARLKQMEIELSQTNIVAPFDGIFDDRPVEVGDYMRMGDVCGLVVELDPLLVIGQVSEDRVGAIKDGSPGTARLVTGETAEGRVHFVSRTADPATRTFRVELEIPNTDLRLRSGVTAEISIPADPVPAHRIPSNVITLNDGGVVGVRIVNEAGRVTFNQISPIDDTPEGLWVTGLPEKVTLITVGQDFVTEGQKVETVPATQAGASL